MNKRLYVGNLLYDVTENELSDLFSQVGSVVYTKIINRPDGKSKGFGFVEMSTEEEAKAATEKFDQYELRGRALKVNEAKPQKKMGFGSSAPSGHYDRDRQHSSKNSYRGSSTSSYGGYKKKYPSNGNNYKDDLNIKLRKLRKDLKDKLRKDK